MKAVVLAGGLGRRLMPYTTILPKPLMPIGDRPVLEIVLQYLKINGVDDVTICIGHLGQLIRAFFDDGSKLGLCIRYSEEDTALGTAGPLDLIRDEIAETILVMNGDILTDIDLSAFLRFHREQGNIATVALVERHVPIDFGIVNVDPENRITGWDEKPKLDYLVSTGLYLLDPKALDYLPKKAFFNIPDLILALRAGGERVGAFRHQGYWLDIGRPDDYEQACRDYDKGHIGALVGTSPKKS
jgi:NDP-sugar pyrophosphorylase family protein